MVGVKVFSWSWPTSLVLSRLVRGWVAVSMSWGLGWLPFGSGFGIFPVSGVPPIIVLPGSVLLAGVGGTSRIAISVGILELLGCQFTSHDGL